MLEQQRDVHGRWGSYKVTACNKTDGGKKEKENQGRANSTREETCGLDGCRSTNLISPEYRTVLVVGPTNQPTTGPSADLTTHPETAGRGLLAPGNGILERVEREKV
jgi:hypothetical protein